jgi:L-seryl-tRNA(Ser) seleniumtransferase
VINAAGVVLHTNLGRAPLSPAALDAIREVAGGYCNLEYELESGRSGRRGSGLESMLARSGRLGPVPRSSITVPPRCC